MHATTARISVNGGIVAHTHGSAARKKKSCEKNKMIFFVWPRDTAAASAGDTTTSANAQTNRHVANLLAASLAADRPTLNGRKKQPIFFFFLLAVSSRNGTKI
jgi:hypothetical protein